MVVSPARVAVLSAAPRIVAADTFTRADDAASLGSPEFGAVAYVVVSGTAGISSNQAYFPSVTSQCGAMVNVGATDMDVQLTTSVQQADTGPILCGDGVNRTWLEFSNVSSAWNIYKRVAGTRTSLASVAGSRTNGDVLAFSRVGNVLTGYLNGAAIVSVVLSAADAATFAGLTYGGWMTASASTGRIDNVRIRRLR